MSGAIFEHGGIEPRAVSDPLAIRRPGWRTVFTGTCGYLRDVRAFVGVVRRDYPNVGVVRGIRIRCGTIAAKGQLLTVRRPGNFRVVVIPGSDLRQVTF